MNNGVTLAGRALARNGSVTLINDTITAAQCATAGTTTGTGTGTGSAGGVGGTTTGGGGGIGGGTARFTTRPPLITMPGIGRCVSGAFKVAVSGRLISRVVFSFAGHVVATPSKAPFSVTVDPGSGTHALTAYVTFSDTTPAKTLKIPVKSCATASRAVTPGGKPAFTG
jgi:hypothetical protein